MNNCTNCEKLKQQHKAEVHDYFMQVQKSRKDEFNTHCLEIEQLKQQHRKELESLRIPEIDINVTYHHQSYKLGYNRARDEINKAITNLLEQKGK